MLFERSGLPFISACCDVLLILVVMLFLRANYAAYRKKRLPTLPELVLTEEMVNNAAASFRAKINYVLLMAHDITLGRDFKLFFKAVIFLWILSVIGSVVSFFTIAYVGTIIFIIVPALYNRFEGHLDGHFSRQYKVVDESIRRLPRNLTKDKDL
nr:reticulon-like protein B16 [Ipomoea batatas]GMC65698.1 reticulon-like protein B16 [Ipomoea batatas]